MTDSESRTQKVAAAMNELEELCKQFVSGLVTVDEMLDKATELRLSTPRLEVGDIDPATGLRRLSPEEWKAKLEESFKS